LMITSKHWHLGSIKHGHTRFCLDHRNKKMNTIKLKAPVNHPGRPGCSMLMRCI
jgi:hypothetical protein